MAGILFVVCLQRASSDLNQKSNYFIIIIPINLTNKIHIYIPTKSLTKKKQTTRATPSFNLKSVKKVVILTVKKNIGNN